MEEEGNTKSQTPSLKHNRTVEGVSMNRTSDTIKENRVWHCWARSYATEKKNWRGCFYEIDQNKEIKTSWQIAEQIFPVSVTPFEHCQLLKVPKLQTHMIPSHFADLLSAREQRKKTYTLHLWIANTWCWDCGLVRSKQVAMTHNEQTPLAFSTPNCTCGSFRLGTVNLFQNNAFGLDAFFKTWP